MELQDYQTEEPITTRTVTHEGDKKIETTITKKGNIKINKKMVIDELETDIKEEEEEKRNIKMRIENENDIEQNSILYDSNSHYSNEINDEKEKISTYRASNYDYNKYVNINRNIDNKYSTFENSDEFKNTSNGANDITDEEIFNLCSLL